MKEFKKRALPFLLSLAMILSSLSVPAHAEEGPVDPKDIVIEYSNEDEQPVPGSELQPADPVEPSTEAETPAETEPAETEEAPKETEAPTEEVTEPVQPETPPADETEPSSETEPTEAAAEEPEPSSDTEPTEEAYEEETESSCDETTAVETETEIPEETEEETEAEESSDALIHEATAAELVLDETFSVKEQPLPEQETSSDAAQPEEPESILPSASDELPAEDEEPAQEEQDSEIRADVPETEAAAADEQEEPAAEPEDEAEAAAPDEPQADGDEEDPAVANVIELLSQIDSLQEMQDHRKTITVRYDNIDGTNYSEEHKAAQQQYKEYVEGMFAKRKEAKEAYDALTDEQKALVEEDPDAAAGLAKLDPYDELGTVFTLTTDYPLSVTPADDEYHFEAERVYELSQNVNSNRDFPFSYALVDASGDATSWTPDGLYEYGKSNYIMTYCCDTRHSVDPHHHYKRINLEDAEYYSDNDAKKIRAIVLVSYPFISMDEMKAILKERGFNAEYADALTRSDITAAVQFAIWKYANRSTPLNEGEYDGMTVYGGTGEIIDYPYASRRLITSMHDYRNELWNWYNTGYNYAARHLTYDEEIAARVDALTEFLTSLPGVDAPDNQIVISDVKVTRSALVEGSADTYDIDLNILLNHGTANGDVTIYVITSPDENPTLENATDYKEIHVSDASEYSLTVTAKYGDTVRVIVDGTQELPKGVYLYEPKGGVETSQSFVGVGEGETRVHAEDSFVFEKEGDMGVRVFKTVKGSQIPISDITFSVYTVVPEEGEELSDVPTPEEIEKYAQEENLAGTMTTDATGYAFLELPRGTYLVVEELNADKVKATADPFYVTLPSPVEQTDDEGNVTIVYEDVVTVYVENTPIDEPGTVSVELEVTKAFEDWGKADTFRFQLEAVTPDAPMPEESIATATKDKPTAVFGQIVYDEEGVYEYTITEINDGADGVTYDTTAHSVTVTVTKESYIVEINGDVKQITEYFAEVEYDGGESLTVTNTYNPAEAEIFVQKELKGREWQDGDEFTFTLAPVDGAPMPLDEDGNELETVVITVKDGKVYSFGGIIYEKAGIYTYTVTETKGSLNGVTYDTSDHTVTVTVSKDQETNELTAAVTYGKPNDDKTAELVTNEYEPASAEIFVQKKLSGREWKEGDEFTFTLAPVDGAPMPLDEDGNELKTVEITVKDGKVYGFGEIEYTEPGTYEYTIVETKGSLDGVTYDTSEHTVTVTVSKDDDNKLTAAVTYGKPNDDKTAELVENKFEPTETEIFVQKELKGREWQDGDEFTFTLAPVDGAPMPLDEDGNELKTVVVTVKDGKVCGFGEIEYTEAGTYKYTIVETKGSLDGVAYDTSEHTVTVTVSKDADNKLTAAVTYGKPNDDKTAELVTNEYEPTEVVIYVQKDLTGRDWKDGDEFTFTLAPVDGAPMPLDEDGNELKTVVVTVKDGKVYGFGEIEYTEAGTYKYTITETKGSLDGVTYDTSEHTVTVVVSKDDDNALSVEITYGIPNDDETAEVITNKFEPTEAEIFVQKKLNGRDWKEGDEFTFTLKPVDGAPMPLDEDGNEMETVEITVKDGKVCGFGEIEYTEAGTYSYTIVETKGSLDGVTYDTSEHTVTVTVSKDADNKLTAAVTYGKPNDDKTAELVENEYEPTEAEIFVQKELKGREWKDGDEFTFTLTPVDGAPMPLDEDGNELKTVTVTVKDGKVCGFGEIEYTEAGTYKYTIVETKGSLDGVAYDTSEHSVTVTVSKDDDNALSAEVTYSSPNEDKTAELVTNEYAPASGRIQVQKELKGREWKDGDEFTFTLAPVDGAPMPLDEDGNELKTVEITVKDGKVYGFGEIEYTEAGTYSYTITETKGSLDGVTYDTKSYTVTVNVAKNEDNELIVTVVYEDEDASAQVITNEFEPTEAEIFVQKELKGREWQDGDEFSFTLAPVDGAPMPLDEDGNEMKTVAVTVKDGKVYGFGEIIYEEAGTYKYTIVETKGDLDGVTYDTSEHTVTVTVAKDADNKLTASVTYGKPNDDKTAELVTNEFEPTEAEIFVQKELKGREWKDGDEFTFTLAPVDGAPMPLDEDGNEMETAQVTVKDGKVYGFGEITYTEAGTYKYTIVETKGSLDGVVYDIATHNVTVEVSKDADNKLTAAVTYGNPNEEKTAELITNEFAPASGQIYVQKELKGRDWKDGDEFTFTLAPVDGAPMPLDEDGNEMETAVVTVTGNGVYGFGLITYEEAGTYKYTITETKGDLDGMTYDTKSYTVTVNVTKDADNKLSVEVIYEDEDASAQVITNEFEPTEAEIFVQKELKGRDWEDGDEFTFTLAPVDGAPMPLDEDGNELETVVITVKDGKVYGFGEITYTKAGTYTYTIVETKGSLDGVAYDTSEHSVTVTVTKDDDNKLTATVTYGNANEDGTAELITNEFTPTEAEIFVQKDLTGRDWEDGDEFTFTLAPVDGAPMPLDEDGNEMETVVITVKDGEVYGFGEIIYNKAGTYTYTIVETKGSLDGVAYETSEHTVTVTVTKDDDNVLSAEVTYGNANEDETAELVTNEFTPTEAEIFVQKKLTGRDWQDGDEFTFTLAPVDGAPMPLDEDGNELETVEITVKDGEVYGFGEIIYNKAGTYTYTIVETKGSLDGVAYDTSEHTVTVTVTKDDDNVLSAEVTYGSPNDDKTAELVENIFTPTTAEISVRKELKGREWQDGDEFTFTLAPVDGAPMPLDEDGNEMATVTVTVKDGEVYGFGTIIYNSTGTYTYTIVEAHGSLDGVGYDANEYTVKVIVSKDEDNALSAKLVYEEDGAEVQIILNEFTPTSAELKVRKDLQGREWRDGDNFRFLLKAVDGAPMPDGAENGELILTVKDDLEHSFGLISYVKAGTYKYILTEIDDGLPGVTYDSSEHTVTVTVSKDEETNALSAEVDAEMTVIVFANPYDSECELVLEAEKELENKDLEEGQFSFILKDEDGNVLQTKSNDADGKVVFDAIAFTEEDFLQDDGTYAESITRIYTVEEVIPDEIPEWYSYDESIYTATVTLTDNGDGTITVDIQWTKDGEKDDSAVFTNSYDEPEWTEKEVIKKWDDNNDSLKKRPDSITVHLLADGEEILTDTITEADGWKKTFTKLRKYAEDDGHEIVYSVTEDKVEGYTAVINGLTITNSMIKAGDESQPVLWSTTFAASTLALGAAILLKRRKEEEE